MRAVLLRIPQYGIINVAELVWHVWLWQQGSKRVPGMAVTKSVVASDSSGKKREEVFVDIIDKISVTFNASVSVAYSPSCVHIFPLFNAAFVVLLIVSWMDSRSVLLHFYAVCSQALRSVLR